MLLICYNENLKPAEPINQWYSYTWDENVIKERESIQKILSVCLFYNTFMKILSL